MVKILRWAEFTTGTCQDCPCGVGRHCGLLTDWPSRHPHGCDPHELSFACIARAFGGHPLRQLPAGGRGVAVGARAAPAVGPAGRPAGVRTGAGGDAAAGQAHLRRPRTDARGGGAGRDRGGSADPVDPRRDHGCRPDRDDSLLYCACARDRRPARKTFVRRFYSDTQLASEDFCW